jgi:hypothetical protein
VTKEQTDLTAIVAKQKEAEEINRKIEEDWDLPF